MYLAGNPPFYYKCSVCSEECSRPSTGDFLGRREETLGTAVPALTHMAPVLQGLTSHRSRQWLSAAECLSSSCDSLGKFQYCLCPSLSLPALLPMAGAPWTIFDKHSSLHPPLSAIWEDPIPPRSLLKLWLSAFAQTLDGSHQPSVPPDPTMGSEYWNVTPGKSLIFSGSTVLIVRITAPWQCSFWELRRSSENWPFWLKEQPECQLSLQHTVPPQHALRLCLFLLFSLVIFSTTKTTG